jgi:hypothetical protein
MTYDLFLLFTGTPPVVGLYAQIGRLSYRSGVKLWRNSPSKLPKGYGLAASSHFTITSHPTSPATGFNRILNSAKSMTMPVVQLYVPPRGTQPLRSKASAKTARERLGEARSTSTGLQ